MGRWYVHRWSNCLLVRAMDGRIMHCGIISSCQSAASSEIVKHFWACVHRGESNRQPESYESDTLTTRPLPRRVTSSTCTAPLLQHQTMTIRILAEAQNYSWSWWISVFQMDSTWMVCLDCRKSSSVSRSYCAPSLCSIVSLPSICIIKSRNKLEHSCGPAWLDL